MMSAAVAGLRSIRPTPSYTNPRDVTLAGRNLVEGGTDPLGAERLAEAPHRGAEAGRIIRVELQVRAIEGHSQHRTTLAHHPAGFYFRTTNEGDS
jgi:hypothetical protein